VRRSSAVNELLIHLLIDKSQVEELRELRQTISNREKNTVTHHGQEAHDDPPLISPVGHLEGERHQGGDPLGESDESYQEGINDAPGTSSLPSQANLSTANEAGNSAWDVELNSNLTAALNLNLVHKLTVTGENTLAFSMDGKYLATASSSGMVSIFDTRTGKRIRQVPLHIFSTRS